MFKTYCMCFQLLREATFFSFPSKHPKVPHYYSSCRSWGLGPVLFSPSVLKEMLEGLGLPLILQLLLTLVLVL